MTEREKAEMWISLSLTEPWAKLVAELQASREGFVRDLSNRHTDRDADMFNKGCIFIVDHILGLPEAAQKLIEEKPDENEEFYSGISTSP